MASPYLPSASSSKAAADAPVTRSRTLFYLSVRDSSSFSRPSARGGIGSVAQYGDTVDVDDDERGGLLGRAPSHRVDMEHGLPPKWVDINDEVEDILERMNGKVATLERLCNKHVMPGFTDRSAEEREIERQTADITRDFRRCSTLVTSITPDRGAARVEVLTAKNVQRGLAQKVQEASAQFRKKQKVYMQKLQGHAIKNKDLLAASGAIKLSGTDSYDALEEDEEASRTQLQSQTDIGLDIEERIREITQIASSISELADLFRDLGSLVVEQGTILDSVEYNIQETSKAVEGAVEELVVAKRYQSNSGKRRCILLLVLIIVGLVIVLIYKPRKRGDSSLGEGTSGTEGVADPSAAVLAQVGTESAVTTTTKGVYQRPPWRPGALHPTAGGAPRPMLGAPPVATAAGFADPPTMDEDEGNGKAEGTW